MCWQCDHPDATKAEYLEHMRGLISRYGWAVTAIEPDSLRPAWAYTVGLTAHGRAELVISGLPQDRAGTLLNDVAEHVLHAEEPVAGERISLRDGPLIEVVRLAVPSAHLRVVADLYGEKFRALQLVHADAQGQWPWERGFLGDQRVLGPRAA
ncbi:uncharacterized protein DUF4262 [Herbihabitans rhizosphaerae]|uniref:Uncharacterized protein DUF4262 n=1 Tax=Herbihabitans rhizosphaerae TaxID=1872711 RepID=A0A4Q7KLN0_9PSEU|nr:DUF4262 domain-containing protein [Herbihabitans rhizosphaerae]RZS37568.1 uncharacterized protein DUF4262 [Herbihabitans rhizosphaerae]